MSDLDKYLENIGINMDEDADRASRSEDASVADAQTVRVEAVKLEGSLRERAESFLVNLLLNFDPSYAVEIVRAEDNEVVADIYGGDPGKVIGREGRTLQALEYITNTILNRQDNSDVRVSIDVEGYKRRRDDKLIQVAQKVAARVKETGQPFIFKPMSAVERRVIHMELAEDPHVMSESTGEGRSRRVVVKLRAKH